MDLSEVSFLVVLICIFLISSKIELFLFYFCELRSDSMSYLPPPLDCQLQGVDTLLFSSVLLESRKMLGRLRDQ